MPVKCMDHGSQNTTRHWLPPLRTQPPPPFPGGYTPGHNLGRPAAVAR